MPHGQLLINGEDAFDVWGVSLDSTALSALMQPAPMKPSIENRSRLENGVRRTQIGRFDERTLKLGMNMWATSESAFMTKYNDFIDVVLTGGWIYIQLPIILPNTEFHCIYVSCDNYGVYQRQLAKFILTLVEPNPADRTIRGSDDE